MRDNKLFFGENSLYVGVDESNRGGDIEIHSAVFSNTISDELLFGKFSKSRKILLTLEPNIITGGRHYTFTLAKKIIFIEMKKNPEELFWQV